MISKIKFYNTKKGWGYIVDPSDSDNAFFFHISEVKGPLVELLAVAKYEIEPVTFETKESTKKVGEFEAIDVMLDQTERRVGNVVDYVNGFGWIDEFGSNERYFMHNTKLVGRESRFISIAVGDPVVFTISKNEKGNEALDIVKVDYRCSLEKFAEFDDFQDSLKVLEKLAEDENWDYIKHPTGYSPVLFSYCTHTFERIQDQKKIILGKSSSNNTKYAYFNTGLVTPFQDEIYGYFQELGLKNADSDWGLSQPLYKFLEFNTDQSHYRKYFPENPEIASYFSEAEVRELVFDTSLNRGKIILDKEHLRNRKSRFPEPICDYDDEKFFDSLEKSIELAFKRIKRNYKTAIPHSYEGKIQFLLPLCLTSKKDADLALVVNKEEAVYKAHTVLTLDQAYNNARLLAKPDREWLNP